MTDKNGEGVVITFLSIGVIIGLIIGGSYFPEHIKGDAVVAFQDGKMLTATGAPIYLNRPLTIEALEGELAVPGTATMFVRYKLTPEEAKILGRGFGGYLANNILVEEFASPLGFKSSGYRTPLPNGVDPTHIVLVQKS